MKAATTANHNATVKHGNDLKAQKIACKPSAKGADAAVKKADANKCSLAKENTAAAKDSATAAGHRLDQVMNWNKKYEAAVTNTWTDAANEVHFTTWNTKAITEAATEADAKAHQVQIVKDHTDAVAAHKKAVEAETAALEANGEDKADVKTKEAALVTATDNHKKDCKVVPALEKDKKNQKEVTAAETANKSKACTDAVSALSTATTAHTDAVNKEHTSKGTYNTAVDTNTKAEAKEAVLKGWVATGEANLTQDWDATAQPWFNRWYTDECKATATLSDMLKIAN